MKRKKKTLLEIRVDEKYGIVLTEEIIQWYSFILSWHAQGSCERCTHCRCVRSFTARNKPEIFQTPYTSGVQDTFNWEDISENTYHWSLEIFPAHILQVNTHTHTYSNSVLTERSLLTCFIFLVCVMDWYLDHLEFPWFSDHELFELQNLHTTVLPSLHQGGAHRVKEHQTGQSQSHSFLLVHQQRLCFLLFITDHQRDLR